MTLQKLYAIIKSRKKTMPDTSYTASLFRAGSNRIAQKVGEEAVELVIAAASQGKERTIEESADLLYHLLVLLAAKDIPFSEIENTLEERNS